MTKYFCDICGKEMSALDMMYIWSIRVQGEGTANRGSVLGKAYDCVCTDCKNKIITYVNNLQNSEEGETNG